jgi:hypothetical protein
MIIKFGPKEKHLKIPDGYIQVTEGVCKKNDKFANVGNVNSPFWQITDEEDWGNPVGEFECLIRKLE